MTKTEFLQELNEALQGEVPAGVIQENTRYYDSYISQEKTGGRSEEEIIEELGGPRIIARTIIDSSEAAGEAAGQTGAYYSQSDSYSSGSDQGPTMKRYDLSKWYWKLLLLVVVIVFFALIFTVVGGVFSLLFRFAGPLIIIWLLFSMFKGMRR